MKSRKAVSFQPAATGSESLAPVRPAGCGAGESVAELPKGPSDLGESLTTATRKFDAIEQSDHGGEVVKAFTEFQDFGSEFGGRIQTLERWRDRLAFVQAQPLVGEFAKELANAEREAKERQRTEAADDRVQRLEAEVGFWRSQVNRLAALSSGYAEEIQALQRKMQACISERASAKEVLREGYFQRAAAAEVSLRTLPTLSLTAPLSPPAEGMEACPSTQSARRRPPEKDSPRGGPQSARGGSSSPRRKPLGDPARKPRPPPPQAAIPRIVPLPPSPGSREAEYLEEVAELQAQLRAVQSHVQEMKMSIADPSKPCSRRSRRAESEELFLKAMQEARSDVARALRRGGEKTPHEKLLQAVLQSGSLQSQLYEGIFPHRRTSTAARNDRKLRADALSRTEALAAELQERGILVMSSEGVA